MKMLGMLAAAAALIATPAGAQVRITMDEGGSINRYMARYQGIAASGEHVVIDGLCFSACTLVLGIVPRERVCVTKNALLGFHAAWRPNRWGDRTTNAFHTHRLMDAYPANVRRWIARNGGLSSEMIFLHGRQLTAMVRPCRTTDFARVAGVAR